ncbi:MAG TPA: TfoX/Sxy family protein [bacterium]|nr:TfoX/Sxy family protein [bacterium]
MAYDEKLADRIREALKGSKGVTEKKMFGGICFLLNGNMIGGVLKDDLIVKFDKADHEKVIAQKHVRPFDFSGRPMAGIVYVGPAALKSKKDLAKWIGMGKTHAAGLPKKK